MLLVASAIMIDLRPEKAGYLLLLILAELDRGQVSPQVSNEVRFEIQPGWHVLPRSRRVSGQDQCAFMCA